MDVPSQEAAATGPPVGRLRTAPARPAGTEDCSEEQLAAFVTRESMMACRWRRRRYPTDS
jgi:hypothetical protein